MAKVFCEICGADIDDADDLFVVAHWFCSVRTYCGKCYARREKTYWHHPRTGSVPLNSMRTTVGLAISLVMIVILLLVGRQLAVVGILSVATVWLSGLRAYSYFKYERPLLSQDAQLR